MLSNDEITNGIPFILKLPDAHGNAVYWTENLKGDVATHWYNIYRSSNWQALRVEAADIFKSSMTPGDAEHMSKSSRCVLIQPHKMNSTELMPARGVA